MTAAATGFDPAEVFSALASPRRLQILEWLRDPVALQKLPVTERNEWIALWKNVDELLGRCK